MRRRTDRSLVAWEGDAYGSGENLRTTVPPALLIKAQEMAAADRITLDELVRDAIERRLNARELDEVFAFGKAQAKARGLKPGDVERVIRDVRFGEVQRSR